MKDLVRSAVVALLVLTPLVGTGVFAQSVARGQSGTAVAEQVPALGEAQIGFLDALRSARRTALAGADDRRFRSSVREAVRQHPEWIGALAAQEGARAATDETRAALLPQVVGQTDGGWRSYDPNRLLGTPERRFSSAGFGVSIRQLLYDFGSAEMAVRSGEARERIAAARAEARRAEIALRAVQAVIDLDAARLQEALARENVQARSAISLYVQQRHELGGGAFSDVLRARAREADARAGAVAALTRVESANASYREVFGTEPPVALEAFSLVDTAAVARVSDLTPAFASVRAASAGREAAEAELRSIISRALPQLNFEGAVSRRDLVGDGWPGNDRTALLNFRYEFYTGGAAQARELQARSRMEQAESDYRSAVLSFERFAAQVFAEARSSDLLLSARIEAVDLAASSLRAVREQFAFRRGTLLDLLNAQEVLQAAGRDLIEGYAQQVLSAYRVLYVASRIDRHFGLVD